MAPAPSLPKRVSHGACGGSPRPSCWEFAASLATQGVGRADVNGSDVMDRRRKERRALRRGFPKRAATHTSHSPSPGSSCSSHDVCSQCCGEGQFGNCQTERGSGSSCPALCLSEKGQLAQGKATQRIQGVRVLRKWAEVRGGWSRDHASDLAVYAWHLLLLLSRMLQLPVQVLEHVLVSLPCVHDLLWVGATSPEPGWVSTATPLPHLLLAPDLSPSPVPSC